MGAADIIPGVSGGTMALITGIYDRLINAIRSVDKETLKSLLTFDIAGFFEQFHWRFLLILLTGIIGAILFFTRIVPLQVYMYTHPEVVYGLFFGLILGSVVILVMEVEKSERGVKTLLPLVIGTLVGYWVVTLVPADTPETALFMFLSGMLAFCTLIIPGISGSYLLLILGKYDYTLMQLGRLGGDGTMESLMAIVPLIVGDITGVVLSSTMLSWLLKHYHTITLMVLVGITIGSLYTIWHWQEREYSETVVDTRIAERSDEAVQQLIESPPNPLAPSYRPLGEIQNPKAPYEDQRIEIEVIERSLAESSPFIPGMAEDPPESYSLWGGIAGLLVGLALVGALDYLRRKE